MTECPSCGQRTYTLTAGCATCGWHHGDGISPQAHYKRISTDVSDRYFRRLRHRLGIPEPPGSQLELGDDAED